MRYLVNRLFWPCLLVSSAIESLFIPVSSVPSPELRGFYFDADKNRYFRLLPGHNNYNPLTCEQLLERERERRRAVMLTKDDMPNKVGLHWKGTVLAVNPWLIRTCDSLFGQECNNCNWFLNRFSNQSFEIRTFDLIWSSFCFRTFNLRYKQTWTLFYLAT